MLGDFGHGDVEASAWPLEDALEQETEGADRLVDAGVGSCKQKAPMPGHTTAIAVWFNVD